MRRRFVTLDVFTNKRFAGNPLAVVLDPEGLDTAAMQGIAREFNLSETVSVFPPADKANHAKLRTFTLEEQVGLVPCRVASSGADSGSASFDIPRLPAKEADSPDVALMAAAL